VTQLYIQLIIIISSSIISNLYYSNCQTIMQ